jgi:F-type H+-transporting ATPase subunit delta
MIAPPPKEIPPRTTAVGETYAAAILPLAIARKEACSTLEELERAAAELEQVEDFGIWIAHPGVPLAKKLELMESAFRHHVSDLTCDVLLVICRHRRLGRLGEIVQALRRRLDEAQGRISVQVISAKPLDDADRRNCRGLLPRLSELHYQAAQHIPEMRPPQIFPYPIPKLHPWLRYF